MRNPVLNEKTFETATYPIELNRVSPTSAMVDSDAMTLSGTINKSLISLCFLMLGACWSYNHGEEIYQNNITFYCVLGVCLILAIIVSFKKESAPYLTIPYVLLEGSTLGFISKLCEVQFHGIVLETLGITITLFVVALMMYKLEIIKVTERLKWGIISATTAIFLFYIFEFILFLCGIRIGFLNNSSIFSIVVSVVICLVATFNLFLDFDLIEKGLKCSNQKKYMEWYCAFGLMVTLIWIYIEVLRLLSKLRKR